MVSDSHSIRTLNIYDGAELEEIPFVGMKRLFERYSYHAVVVFLFNTMATGVIILIYLTILKSYKPPPTL